MKRFYILLTALIFSMVLGIQDTMAQRFAGGGDADENNYVHLRGDRTGSNLGVKKFPNLEIWQKEFVMATPYVDTAYKIYDFGGLLKSSQIKEIERRCHEFVNRTGLDIAIVTLRSNDHPRYESHNRTESFIMDFYDYNDFKADGVMLCLDISNSRNSIYDAGKPYRQDFMGIHLDEYGPVMRPMFDREDYYGEIMWFINQAEEDWLYSESFPIWKCSIIGFALALMFFFIHKSKYKLVFKGAQANNYKVPQSFVLTGNKTTFVRSYTTKVHSPRQSSGGGGSRGSSGGGHSGGSF